MVAAAIVGAAVVGAGATAYSSNAASKSTSGATNAAIGQQQQALNQQSTLSAPYRSLGESAMPSLRALLGLGAGTGQDNFDGAAYLKANPDVAAAPWAAADPWAHYQQYGKNEGRAFTPLASTQPGDSSTALTTLRTLPGYQFQKQEGLDATKNSASAMGLTLSGNTLRALDSYSTGLADSTYQQQVGNLENVVGMGQSAAAGQANNVGNAANNTGNLLVNQGNVQAGIDANAGASYAKIASNAANQYATNQTLADIYDFYEKPRKVWVEG